MLLIPQLWDCSKFEGSNRVNKHQRLFNHHNGSAINGLAVSADGQLLVSGAENGTISTYKYVLILLFKRERFLVNMFIDLWPHLRL